MGDSPQALPCPSSAMRPRMMVSSLSLSVPTSMVGLAHHSMWILTLPRSPYVPTSLHPPWGPSPGDHLRTAQGQTWEGSCLGPGAQAGKERRGELPWPSSRHPTLHHPSGWPHCPCLPGEDPKGLGGESGQQQGG